MLTSTMSCSCRCSWSCATSLYVQPSQPVSLGSIVMLLFCSWSFKWTFCKRFATKFLYEFHVFPTQITCPFHCYVVDFVVLTILVDCCKRLTLLVWNGLNCSFPSSLLWIKYFPKHFLSPLLVPRLKILGHFLISDKSLLNVVHS
jgi:hypothetical protein